MADSNLYGLPTVQAALDSTSQLYAVTGSAGSFTDTRLPVAVLFNNAVLTGTPTIAGYLTSALAASTYLTQANAASTYLSITTAASTYLTQTNASSTYLTITTAASTYATITNLALKAPSANPNFTGTATAQAITLTNILTPSTTVGIKGTTLADNAQAGSIGEYMTATGTAVPVTTSTAANITSITLTAGDWDVWGNIEFIGNTGTLITGIVGSVSLTSATTTPPPFFSALNGVPFNSAAIVTQFAPIQRINVSTNTVVFLVGQATFTVSTVSVNGYIAARRRR